MVEGLISLEFKKGCSKGWSWDYICSMYKRLQGRLRNGCK